MIYIKLVFAMLFWGLAFCSGRILSQSFDPFVIAFLRFLSASIVFIMLMYYRNREFYKLSLIQHLKVMFLGLTGVFLYNYFFFNGLKLIEAGRSAVIIGTNPAVSTLIAMLFLGEPFSFKKIIGIFCAFCGVSVVISHGSLDTLLSMSINEGEIYIIAAVFSWVTYTVAGKIVLKKLTSLEASAWASIWGMIFLFPFALNSGLEIDIIRMSFIEWGHILNLGLLATFLGFIWYYDGIKTIGVTKGSSFINLIPIFGISFGIIFLGEKPDWSLFFGAIIVIFGVFLVNKKEKV